MKTYAIAEAKARLSEIVRLCREQPIEIRRRGRRAAVLISPQDYETLEKLREIVNVGCALAGVRRAAELYASGEDRRAIGLFRAIVPYFRRAGVRDPRPPRISPQRSLPR
ncbi:MAG: type II toxin-antitoxin system Phd/YefM family antitoxin [Parvularculaceae bacterium]|nr:type II toxin-antitoxin system Phd/YefM family antitoxin [Parvularculaceae bacterium]